MSQLRPYQRPAVAAAARKGGLIVAPTGSGKTRMGVDLCASLRPALVLVHTRELVEQWTDALRRHRVPVDDADAAAPMGVVVMTMQSAVARRRKRKAWAAWTRGLRLVVIDEAHHAAAATWRGVIASLSHARVVGLTATPERLDGQAVSPVVGGVAARVDPRVVEAAGGILRPIVRQYATRWSPEGGAYRDELAVDPDRARVVVRLARDRLAAGRRVLVVVERVEHADELARRLGASARPLHGALRPSVRTAHVEAFKAGRVRALVLTAVGDEGLDLPDADCSILAVPTRATARLLQRVGRVLRPGRSKLPPEVWDLVDDTSDARAGAAERRRIYARRGWAVEQMNRFVPGG